MRYQSSRLRVIANIKVCCTYTNPKQYALQIFYTGGMKNFVGPLMLCTKFQGHLTCDSRDVFLKHFYLIGAQGVEWHWYSAGLEIWRWKIHNNVASPLLWEIQAEKLMENKNKIQTFNGWRMNNMGALGLIEPVHEISNNVVCATSKASDQPAHTRSLIRAFVTRLSIL